MPYATQAYVIRKANDPFKIEDVVIDEVRAGEVLVETVAFSVCASDIKAAHGTFHLQPPLVPGHEAAGIVKEVGPNVTSVKAGDPVVLTFAACNTCPQCLDSAPAYCDKIWPLNFSGHRNDGSRPLKTASDGLELNSLFFGQSSMSRLVLAHESSLVPLPQETTIEELRKFATLGCGMQTGAGAILNVAQPRPSSRIAILGTGAVGLAAALAALTTCPAQLILLDSDARKFALLPSALRRPEMNLTDPQDIALNPTHPPCSYVLRSGVEIVPLVASTPAEAAKLVGDATGGKGATHVLDCAGSPEHISALIPALAKRGMMVTVGGAAPSSPDVSVKVLDMLVGGRTWRGTHQGDGKPGEFVPRMIAMWRAGEFGFDELQGVYGFGELEKGLQDLREGRVVKVVCVVK